MSQQVPPLAAVRVFEAAARLGSFTKAAAELGMTQAAVSYQIKVLEERAVTALFLRRPRQVELTDAGRRFAPRISEAFSIMAEAYASVRGNAQDTLNITTLLTFATNWLARHLVTFQIANPNIAIRVDTGNEIVDFAREEFDVGIRSGRGEWPGLVSHKLLDTSFTPMMSRKLAEQAGELKEPADLLRLPLLDPGDWWWARWFAEAGVPDPDLAGRPDMRMGTQAYEASAAMAGHGVAILSREFFLEDLEQGRLVQPFDIVCDDGYAYWLVYPETRRNLPKIKAFRQWILAEVERTTETVA